jgi:hypothetical protein
MPYKAKIFTHHFITTRTIEETEVFEDAMRRKLLGTLSKAEFFEILDKPSQDGGVGFDKRTAKNIADEVEETLDMGRYVYKKYRQRKNLQGKHDPITDNEKAKTLVTHLLKKVYYEHYHELDERQLNRMRDAVRNRLIGNYDKEDFLSFLDMPFKKGGVGLNIRTAQLATEEMELIMVLGFGMKSAEKKKAAEKKAGEKIKKEIRPQRDDGLDMETLEMKARKLRKKEDQGNEKEEKNIQEEDKEENK